MKKWITVDAFIVAFFSAMGYGFGYSIPAMLDLPAWLCLVISIAGGMVMEEIASKIIYSKFTQEKAWRKLLVFAAFIVIFLIGNVISTKCMGESLIGGLKEEWGYVAIFAVFGFVFSLAKYYYKTVKAKKRYGSGEEGFRFNEEEKAYMQGLNQKNAEITGKYDSSLAAKTRTGVYVGEKGKDFLAFKGIPYAKAPVGRLRWKAPEKLPDSAKVFEAKYFGPSSIQVNYEANLLNSHQQSEDCLYLNVYTAETASKSKKPVVVYFHGGDFTFGGSADPLWEVENFVKAHSDVVTVSFNYRLGLLGFIDFSKIPGGEKYPDAGNLGLLDQIAALKWVKENISAFGGDPERITVMGDGSGSISISLLAVCARAKGLFQEAVLINGNPENADVNNVTAVKLADQLLKEASASNVEDLLALPENKLAALTQKLKAYLAVPIRDGKLIPQDVYEAYKKGAAKDIQFVLFASRDNANSYSAYIGRGFSEKILTKTTEEVLSDLKPEAMKKLKDLIDAETERVGKAKAETEFINLWMDHVSLVRLAKALSNGGGSVRMLYWDVDAVVEKLGVGSINIVSTILGNDEAAAVYGSVVKESISEVLQAFLMKVIQGEALELYTNEIEGVNGIKWATYPGILAVTKNKVQLQSVENTLTDAKEMLDAAGITL